MRLSDDAKLSIVVWDEVIEGIKVIVSGSWDYTEVTLATSMLLLSISRSLVYK
jgi:hypothetical protein